MSVLSPLPFTRTVDCVEKRIRWNAELLFALPSAVAVAVQCIVAALVCAVLRRLPDIIRRHSGADGVVMATDDA